VYVAGKLRDTTPLQRPMAVPEGRHRLELRNPYFKAESREVQVQRNATQTVRVALKR
jgi:hypothetical protein